MMWHVLLWAGIVLVSVILAAIAVVTATAVAVTIRDMWKARRP